MLDFLGPLLTFFRRHIGIKTDAANPAGTVHAKLASIIASINGIPIIKSIQRGTIVLSSSQTINTGSISAVVTAKSVVNFLGVYAAGISADSGDPYYARWAKTGHQFVKLALTNSTTVTATRAETNTTAATVGYEVIEYY